MGCIVVGYTESNNEDVSGNHGDKDAWVLKLSSIGSIQWKKCYGGSQWEEASTIHQTNDGGYIFAGLAQSLDGDVSGVHGDLDYWVVKLDSTGTIVWQKAFGGSGEDTATEIRQTLDGGYIVAGKTDSEDGDVIGNHGSDDYWVVKLNGGGAIEWTKALGGNSADVAEDIWQTVDGGYILVGYALKSSNTGDVTGHHGGFSMTMGGVESMSQVEKSLNGRKHWEEAWLDYSPIHLQQTQRWRWVMPSPVQTLF